jgi:DNA repair protein RAD5
MLIEVTDHQVIIENLEFSPIERKIYDSLYKNAKQKFENWNDKGAVSKNYTSILAMLMRLVVLY